jgi:uncharacterized protein YbjT (DUF2867 family)
MKVILFGGSGMVGQGVLRECLMDSGVQKVLSVGRTPLGKSDAKLEELLQKDLYDVKSYEAKLAGYDACFFCLGVSSAGMSEADYTRVTYELTLAVAEALARLNPAMTFIYVSGEGTDSTEKGGMWSRVKGRTENALLKLPFKAAYMFRPGLIQPRHGIKSKTTLYQAFYLLGAPLMPVMRALAPGMITDTEKVGRAMLKAARDGAPKPHLHTKDINALVA